MALGKPVLVYIREDLERMTYEREYPIINTNPFKEKLKLLTENSDLREEYGRSGREYGEEVHDALKIANWFDGFYKKL
jgi:hypothetical protein